MKIPQLASPKIKTFHHLPPMEGFFMFIHQELSMAKCE